MRHWIFGVDGIWTGRVVGCSVEDLALNLAEGETAHPNVEYAQAKRVVEGVLVDFVPPSPSDDHEWDAVDRLWRLKREVAQRIAARRDTLTQIETLEKQQARAIREHAIGRGGTPAELRKRLEDIDDQITALRAQLT